MEFISKNKVYFAGLLRCMVFGSGFVGMKIALESINPMMLIFGRHVIAAFILNFVFIKFKKPQRIEKKDFKYLIILGIIEPILFYIFDAFGLLHTTAIRASLILAITPVIVALSAGIFLRERLTPVKVISSIGSVFGVFLVVTAKEPFLVTEKYLLGDILILIAAVLHASFTLFSRKLSFSYSPFTITRFQSIVGFIGFLPLAAGEFFVKGFETPSKSSILALVYLGVIVSSCGFLLIHYTIANLSAANSSIFQNLTPAATMLLSVLILGEYVGLQKFSGLIVISVFVFILSWYERRKTV